MFLAGPLADQVMGPAMMPDGVLAPVLGWLVGTGPGAGIAVIFIIGGIIAGFTSLGGFAVNAIRNVEDIIPDHEILEVASVPMVVDDDSN